jgi:hypothetical protein
MNCSICHKPCYREAYGPYAEKYTHPDGYTHCWCCDECLIAYECIDNDDFVAWGNFCPIEGITRFWLVGDKWTGDNGECTIWDEATRKTIYRQAYSDPMPELIALYRKYLILQ